MHRIPRATRGIGCDRREKCRIEYAEANFFSFHVAIGDSDPKVLMDRITVGFGPPGEKNAADKEHGHRSPHRPAVFLVLYHSAEVVRQPASDRKNRKHLEEIRKRRWILEWMRRIG